MEVFLGGGRRLCVNKSITFYEKSLTCNNSQVRFLTKSSCSRGAVARQNHSIAAMEKIMARYFTGYL
jgi:hypothetical protein